MIRAMWRRCASKRLHSRTQRFCPRRQNANKSKWGLEMRIGSALWNATLTGLATLTFAGPGICQTGPDSVFLVSGFPTGRYVSSIQSTLYMLGTSGSLQKIQTISDSQADAILPDYEDGIVVISSPSLVPSKMDVIHFRDRLSIETRPLAFDSSKSVVGTRILANSGSEPPLVLFQERAGVALGSETVAFSNVSEEAVSLNPERCLMVGQGSFGVAVVWSDAIRVRLVSGNLSVMPSISKQTMCHPNLQSPKGLEQADAGDLFLDVDTKKLSVVSSTGQRSLYSGVIGYQLVHVLYKPTGTWHDVHVPGYVSWPRGFGNWVAYVVATRGSTGESATSPLGPETKTDQTNAEFDESGADFPGKLFLYNAALDRSFTVTTGRRDTEPLLIDDNTLYFRVDSSVYRTELGGSAALNLADAKLVATDPRISNIHWAFLSRP